MERRWNIEDLSKRLFGLNENPEKKREKKTVKTKRIWHFQWDF